MAQFLPIKWESRKGSYAVALTETFKVNSYANKAALAGDGSTTTITVGSGYNVNQFFVTINGVDQEPTEDFTYSGTTITLDAAPASGDRVVVRY